MRFLEKLKEMAIELDKKGGRMNEVEVKKHHKKHHIWCNDFMGGPAELCKSCQELKRNYPEGEKTEDELMKKHFPNNVKVASGLEVYSPSSYFNSSRTILADLAKERSRRKRAGLWY